MAYIKKVFRELLERMDYLNYIPDKWDEFVYEQEEKQNIIIKKGKECVCSNCKHIFHSNKKINEKVKCPNCKNEYLIKRSNLKNFTFKDDLAFLDRIDNTYFLRLYELRSEYDNSSNNYKFNRSVVEYARIIPGEYNCTFINERVSRCQCHIYVSHCSNARQLETLY